MSKRFSLDLIRESCHLALVCPNRGEFISMVSQASEKEGASSEEARALAQTLADTVGLTDAGQGALSDDPALATTAHRRAPNPFMGVAAGLLWGMAILAGGITVLNIGSEVIDRWAGATSLVSDCRSVGCVPQ